MRKEIIIMISIVILVLFFNTLTQNYTKKTVDTVTEELEVVKRIIDGKQYESEQLESRIHTIEDLWNDRREILSYYLEHDEIEKIELELTAIGANSVTDNYDSLRENLERCIFLLEHVQRKETFALSNIF